MRPVIAAMVLAALLSSGCSAVLYYGFPETTTREVDRRARVVVRSHPRGAVIATAGGEVLGAAPLEAEIDYKVRRTVTRNSTKRAALGCVVDSAALVGVIAFAPTDSTAGDIAFYGTLGMFAGCFALAYVKLLNTLLMERYYRTTQAPLLLSSPIRRDDEVVAGDLELEARWSTGGRARITATGPGQSEVLLRQPPARTFDEALMRYDESHSQPLGPEGIYRRGRAFFALAKHGGGSAAARRAIADLERARSAEGIDATRAAEIDRMLSELGSLEAGP